ncbi:MAG: hypothetical protein HYX65_04250 [Gemmatimonadetes bacterium]|nr:hypothetical protein [Gemmatimonadota bacterium]
MRSSLRPLALAATTLVAVACSDSSSTGTGPVATGAATLSGTINVDRTLSKDTVYTLSGFVNVANGRTLTIPAGTRLVGDTNVAGSSLFILRGARIIANGTAAAPIVFTSARSPGNRKPGDWGGLILVGNGRNNRAGTVVIEGSDAAVPGGIAGGVQYNGGTDDNDNSGVLRYVRVEFAGYAVALDQELNSFSMGAIGRGTTMEYLQSMAGLDDSFEFWGGAVNARYLVSYESGDDHFDTSEGYKGKVQFLIGLQSTLLPPRAGTGSLSSDPQGFEVDGCNGSGCTAPPGGNLQSSGATDGNWTMNVFSNFTLVGTGPGVVPAGGGYGAVLRRGTGGVYMNGIFARWPSQAITIRDTTTNNRLLVDSLTLSNIYSIENAATFDAGSATTFGTAATIGSAFTIAPGGVALSGGVFQATFPAAGQVPSVATLNWQPIAGAPVNTIGLNTFAGKPNIAARAGTFIQPTSFVGAVDPAAPTRWYEGWTVYYRN